MKEQLESVLRDTLAKFNSETGKRGCGERKKLLK